MAVAVPLRCDFYAAQLRALAKRSRDPDQTRPPVPVAIFTRGRKLIAALEREHARKHIEPVGARAFAVGRGRGGRSGASNEPKSASWAGPNPRVRPAWPWPPISHCGRYSA